jgi:hypothetical protein
MRRAAADAKPVTPQATDLSPMLHCDPEAKAKGQAGACRTPGQIHPNRCRCW